MSSTIKQAILSLKSRIADAYTAVVAKGGTLPATQDSANLPSAIASIPSGGGGVPIGGITFLTTPPSVLAFFLNPILSYINIDDDTVEDINISRNINLCGVPNQACLFSVEKTMRFRKAKTLIANCVCNWSAVEEVYFDVLETMTIYRFLNADSRCKLIYVPKIRTIPNGFPAVLDTNTQNLIDITLGENLTASFSLANWNPTNALNASSSSLVEQGEPFANNLEKLLYNIREHIAANLPVANYTVTFHAHVKAAILADQATQDAFTNKGWTIA